jgi:hypothetical protein
MKNFTCVILILSITTIAGCNYRNNKIQISGKIIGSNDSMLILYMILKVIQDFLQKNFLSISNKDHFLQFFNMHILLFLQ